MAFVALPMRHPDPGFSPPSQASSEWLTTQEVATLLRVHPKHVYRLLHQGMPARRVGGQWRFSRADIQHWADQRGGIGLPMPSRALAPPSTFTLALEPNEIADAVAAVFRDGSPAHIATVATTSRRAIELLESGELSAAIVRTEDARRIACATLRVGLGARELGVISIPSNDDRPKASTIATPPTTDRFRDRLCAILQGSPAEGAAIRFVGSDLEACGAVLRRDCSAAFSSRNWAHGLGLTFHPVFSEAWELAIRVDAMEDPTVSRICVAAQGDVMRDALSRVRVDLRDGVGQMRLERGAQPGADELIAPGDALPHPSKRSRRAVRWTILTRHRADQMLGLARVLKDNGLQVGGFVQVPSGPSSDKPLGYDLYRLAKPERAPLADRIRHDQQHPSGEKFCDLSFHPETLARACEWLKEDVGDADVLIVDGVGRLETQGQGLFPALAWVRSQDRPKMMILSSRPSHVPAVTKRLSLADKHVSELSLGADTVPPASVVNHILGACGRGRRPQAKRV